MFVYVACMLRIPIFLVYKGISSEIRVCCAGFVNSKNGLLGFASQYLCFQAPIPMILHLETIGFRNGSNYSLLPSSHEGTNVDLFS